DLDLQPEVGVEESGGEASEQHGEGSVLDRNRVSGLVPFLGSGGGGIPETEADGVGSIRNGGSIGFGEMPLEVHQGGRSGDLSLCDRDLRQREAEGAEGEQRQECRGELPGASRQTRWNPR